MARELHLRSALINGHTGGVPLDDERFTGLWEAAESLGVPICIHPADPHTPFAACQGYPLQEAAFGWTFDSARSVVLHQEIT